MLYQVREAQRAVLTPVSGWAEAMSKLYSSPYSPFSYMPLATRAAAGFELLHRHRQGVREARPSCSRTTRVAGTEVPVVEQVEMELAVLPAAALRARAAGQSGLPGGRPEGADLRAALGPPRDPAARHGARHAARPQRATSPTGSTRGWCRCRKGDFHLHDYVAYCIEFIRHLGPDVHLMSVCQPTVPVLAAASIMATLQGSRPGAQHDDDGRPDRPAPEPDARSTTWRPASPSTGSSGPSIHRVPGRYPGAGRRVYPGFLQHAGFVAMNPDRHAQSHWDFYLNLVRGDLEDAESHRDVLQRVQRRAGPAGGLLPRDHPDGVPGVPPAARERGKCRSKARPCWSGRRTSATCRC